jgi:hypothetical protein
MYVNHSHMCTIQPYKIIKVNTALSTVNCVPFQLLSPLLLVFALVLEL